MPRRRDRHLSPFRPALELLEAREVPAIVGQLRVVDYNILNLPNTAAMTTVLQAIGNQTVGGITRPLDVLLLQEVDSSIGGQAAQVRDILNTLYGANTYAVGTLQQSQASGGDRQAIVYRNSSVDLVGQVEVTGASGPRAPMRYQLRPEGMSAAFDFYVYNSHYDAVDAPDRLDEALAIRANSDALGQGAEILYAGDYNIDTSTEDMYDVALQGAGNGQAFDPINTPGSWASNSGFRAVHTQSTRVAVLPDGGASGGMDDRFDFVLHSQEVGASGTAGNGVGLEYRAGSYRAYGNNNTHTYNGDINTGSGFPAGVLDALRLNSDHLPIVVDYDIVTPTVASSTALVSGTNPSVFGQSVTFTATVTGGSGTPTGTVTFFDGPTQIGTGTLNGSGVAIFSTSSLSVAAHNITATYGGNATYDPSTSAVVSQTVNRANTTLALVSSVNPSAPGQSVTFTATIAADAPGAGTPTGTVTFFDGVTQIGTGSLSSGTATFSTSTLTSGTHVITAQYAQTTSFNASTSPTVNQNVTGGAAGSLQFSSATYSTAEGQGFVTVTVTRTGGSTGAVGVTFATGNGTATQPGDYATATGTLSWADGDAASKTFTVAIVDDGSGEASETFTVALSSPTGGATLGTASATVTITDPLLLVASRTPTAGGVILNMNRAVATADLNLYDGAAGTLGAADVTLTGNTTGAVRGSLIVLPGNRLHFVRTGASMPGDTYTLAARSAADGFKDLAGVLLDGDANGTAGGNYSTSFAVGSSTARVLSVPDFTRGAGQAVNVPATSSGLPVRISDPTGVTSAQVDLLFDTTLLNVTTGTFTSGAVVTIPGSTVTITAIAGGVRVAVTGLSGVTGSNVAIAAPSASVPATAPYASKQVVAVRNVSVNGGAISAAEDDAVHVAAYLGDANASRTLSGGDSSLVSQLAVAIGTGFLAYQNADPLLVADINQSGTLTGGDSSQISLKSVGSTVPSIPDIPGGVTPPAGGPDPILYLVGGAARRGGTIAAELRLFVSERGGIELSSVDAAIRFDATRFEVRNVRTGSLVPGFGTFANVDNVAGTIRLTQFTGLPEKFTFGTDGAVVLFDLVAKSSARPGPTALNLAREVTSNGSTTFTMASGPSGSLTLAPAPTNAATDPVDATVVILGRRFVAFDVSRDGVALPDDLGRTRGRTRVRPSPPPFAHSNAPLVSAARRAEPDAPRVGAPDLLAAPAAGDETRGDFLLGDGRDWRG